MASETIYSPAIHGQLDPAVESGLEATIGAPLRHWLITTEDVHGQVTTIMPNDQYPHVSRNLAQRTVDRLS